MTLKENTKKNKAFAIGGIAAAIILSFSAIAGSSISAAYSESTDSSNAPNTNTTATSSNATATYSNATNSTAPSTNATAG